MKKHKQKYTKAKAALRFCNIRKHINTLWHKNNSNKSNTLSTCFTNEFPSSLHCANLTAGSTGASTVGWVVVGMLSVIPCGGEGWSWSVASSADCVGVGWADELSVVGGATEDLITGEYSIGESFPLQFVPNRRSRCFEVLHKLNQSHSFAAKVDVFRRLQI